MTAIGRFLGQVERWFTWTALAALVAVVLWGVLTRYVTARPAPWTSELAGILFTWVVFLGAATAFREGRHIRIDLFGPPENGGAARLCNWLADLMVLAFLVTATVLAAEMLVKGASRPSPVLRIPFSLVYLAPVLSFGTMALSDALVMVRRFGAGRAQA